MNKVIKTKNYSNFCGGCNNTILMHRFVQVDEGQSFESAWEQKNEEGRERFLGFCLCGNIYLFDEYEK